MNKGEDIIRLALYLAATKHSDEIQFKVFQLVKTFCHRTEDLDLLTICKIEALLGEELLMIPTKQQWRKIKLEKLNEMKGN